MQRTQRSISIRQQILSKLNLQQMQGNPICPIRKSYKQKTGKLSKKARPTIEEEIFSSTSIKVIKPYKTEKLIEIQPSSYQICTVLQSSSYKKLQNKLSQMIANFNKKKNSLSRDIKKLDKSVRQETSNGQQLCERLIQLDENFQGIQAEYYEIKRKNYDLRVQLSSRRQISELWNHNINTQSFQRQNNYQPLDIDNMSYEQILQMEERIGKQNVGLQVNTIAKLRVSKLSQIPLQKQNQNHETNCCICCQQIEQDQSIIQLQCSHIHHAECIKSWLKIKRFCPLCKRQVNPQTD